MCVHFRWLIAGRSNTFDAIHVYEHWVKFAAVVEIIILFLCAHFTKLNLLIFARQAIGNFALGIYKLIDYSPEEVKNKTTKGSMKRAPAFASKYSLSEYQKFQKENLTQH